MRSHSVTCHPAEVTFPPLPQPKLVLDLATPEGCKAELTWVVVISQDSLPAKYGLRNNQEVSWPALEPATASHKSNVLTITPPIHPSVLSPLAFLRRDADPSWRSGESCKFSHWNPGRSPAASAFLVYIEPRERVWWLQMLFYFC